MAHDSTGTTPVQPPERLKARLSAAYERPPSRELLEQQWIMDNLSLVRHLVSKLAYFLRNEVDREDLISAGTLGLIKAAKAFDPLMQAEFRTYAYIRIRGAILDEMRSRSFMPVSTHRQVKRMEDAYSAFVSVHGRPPDDEQLADALGLSMQELAEWLTQARRQHFLCIHGMSDDSTPLSPLTPLAESASPQQVAEHRETKAQLAQAIEQLPPRDRQVILLYYARNLTMKEVAAVLEVTESRVSQIHAAALFRLSMQMRSDE